MPTRLFPLLLLALPFQAAGQTVSVPQSCVRQCGASSPTVRSNPVDIQACLIRCNAAQGFQREAARATPQQPLRRGLVQPGAAVAPAPLAAPLPPSWAAAAPRATQPPPGARTPPPSRSASATTASVGAAAAGAGAAAARPGNASGPRYGAIYLAPPPAAGHGLSFGMPDRLSAHTRAEGSCQSRGVSCRSVLEFTDRCGAVAQARRANGLIRTADPSTYTITFAAGGAGPTQQAAEAQAVADCRQRDRSAACEIVASGCG